MKLQNVIKFILPAVLLLMASGVSQAGLINGALPLNPGGTITLNGANLGLATTVTATNMENASFGTGDYAFIPLNTDFGPNVMNLGNLTAYTFTNATYGTFQAIASGSNIILDHTANFLDVFLIGTFTPITPNWPAGFVTSQSSLRYSANQSGAAISIAVTLNTPDLPPPGVPEPATMALLGSALVGLGIFGRKRFTR